MKRLAFWGAVCIGGIVLQLAFTYRFFGRYIDSRASSYGMYWAEGLGRITDTSGGWQALTPYYAWPVLVTYGGALVVLGSVVAVAVARSIALRERQLIAGREAAVDLQEAQVRIDAAEVERIRKVAQDQVQAAMDQVARCKQEAAAQIKEANDRMQRSVNTNMGRQRTIQKLRKRVKELGGEDDEEEK